MNQFSNKEIEKKIELNIGINQNYQLGKREEQIVEKENDEPIA